MKNLCPECESPLSSDQCAVCGWFNEEEFCDIHRVKINVDYPCKMCLQEANEDYVYETYKDMSA